MDPLQLVSYVVEKHLAGEQETAHCFSFASLRNMIGIETRATYSTNYIHAKLNQSYRGWVAGVFQRLAPVTPLSVFTVCSHRLLVIIIFALIGRCNDFRVGLFTTLNRKVLYS